jgi:hypothetical protein
MIRRREHAVGIKTEIGRHTFRALVFDYIGHTFSDVEDAGWRASTSVDMQNFWDATYRL